MSRLRSAPILGIATALSLLTVACDPGDVPVRDGGGGIDAASGDDGGSTGDDAGVTCAADCSAMAAAPCMMFVCNDGSLPGTPGQCVMVAMADGASCDDGDFCTVGETCTAGSCGGGSPNDCGMTAGACEEIVCDSTAEACSAEPSTAMNGMACAPGGDLCISGATCSDGACTGGTPTDCSSTPVPNACQEAVCNPATGACELTPTNEGGSCEATNLCTTGNTCTAGTCGGGAPTDCTGLDTDCAIGVCDPSDGSCTTTPFNEGGACDDGDSCTSSTTCTSGVCGGGTEPACSATMDGCCPSACSAADDADCACPGEWIGGTCVYLPSTATVSDQTTARAACTALGAGWDLCDPTMLCMSSALMYMATTGCSCTGGASTCACGSAANIYVHVDGPDSPYYARGPMFPGCLTSMACTDSVSETCGVPLCCL